MYDGITASPALTACAVSASTTDKQRPLHVGDAAPDVEPQVHRDLVVARAAGVEAQARLADPLHQLALDERMDVLVGPGQEGGVAPALFEDRGEPVADHRGVGRGEHAGPLDRLGPGEASR